MTNGKTKHTLQDALGKRDVAIKKLSGDVQALNNAVVGLRDQQNRLEHQSLQVTPTTYTYHHKFTLQHPFRDSLLWSLGFFAAMLVVVLFPFAVIIWSVIMAGLLA